MAQCSDDAHLAVFSALATFYFWLGSWHEERRLIAAYGDAYRTYVNGRVPFFFGTRTLIPNAAADGRPNHVGSPAPRSDGEG